MIGKTAALLNEIEFDDREDGYMEIGPLRGISLSELERKMKRNRVFAYTDDCDMIHEVRADGNLYVTAFSSAITGYLLDENRSEASSSDVEFFLLDLLAPGEMVAMEGSYPDGFGGIVVSRARYRRVGGEILGDITRSRYDADGVCTPIFSVSDLQEFEIRSQTTANANVVCLNAYRKRRAS